MDYTLAKKLKDAGFPFSERWSLTESFGATVQTKGGATIQVPTISELIEACGKDVALFHHRGAWNAVKTMGIEKAVSFVGVNVFLGLEGGKGLIPEEAVAKLWLALNKK